MACADTRRSVLLRPPLNLQKRPRGAVALAKRLRRASPKTGERMSLRKISAELEAEGHRNERGQRYDARSIKHDQLMALSLSLLRQPLQAQLAMGATLTTTRGLRSWTWDRVCFLTISPARISRRGFALKFSGLRYWTVLCLSRSPGRFYW